MGNPGRTCTVCNASGKLGRAAKFVATAADGAQWYECEGHSASDNVLGELRIHLEPIDEWFRRIPEPS